MANEIMFEELAEGERKLLLRAFDYDVDEAGFIITPAGNKIRSKENPNEFLLAKDALLTAGSLNVLDGTPSSISKFLREKVEQEDGTAKCR